MKKLMLSVLMACGSLALCLSPLLIARLGGAPRVAIRGEAPR